MTSICEGSNIRYDGDLPDDWSHTGYVTVLTPDASGDAIATVLFDDGHQQDIPASELTLDPSDTSPRYEDWSDGAWSKAYHLPEAPGETRRRCPMCDEFITAAPQPWCQVKDNHEETGERS